MGSNMLQLPATFSQLAHSVDSLAALNTVPGNSYSYARPSKPVHPYQSNLGESKGQLVQSTGRDAVSICTVMYKA